MVEFFYGFFVALVAVILSIGAWLITKEKGSENEDYNYDNDDEMEEILKFIGKIKKEGTQ
tara:strand:- start:628 stop:807 length:180 start_codon:yes stop_codon:yes gene_type:complete